MRNEVTSKAKVVDFRDLVAWQKSHHVTLLIYQITQSFPRTEQFGLTSQLRRAASSTSANIAEGFARYHYKDKIRFYYQARGSNAEVQNFVLLAQDLGYMTKKQCTDIDTACEDVRQLINGMIRSIDQQASKKPTA